MPEKMVACLLSYPVEIVFKSDYVILTQVGPGLDFNEYQVGVFRILNPVTGFGRDEDRLAFSQVNLIFIQLNKSVTGYYCPVFRPMLMALQ